MCPVTGETIGHSLPTPQAATKTNTDKISSEPVNQEKLEKPANSQKEGETKPVTVTEPEASPTPAAEATPAKPVTLTESVAVTDPPYPISAISSSPAAPLVKTRRVPPGGHPHALW